MRRAWVIGARSNQVFDDLVRVQLDLLFTFPYPIRIPSFTDFPFQSLLPRALWVRRRVGCYCCCCWLLLSSSSPTQQQHRKQKKRKNNGTKRTKISNITFMARGIIQVCHLISFRSFHSSGCIFSHFCFFVRFFFPSLLFIQNEKKLQSIERME